MATHSCHLCSLSFKHTPECTKQREYEGKLVYVCDHHAREGLDAKLSRAPADFGPGGPYRGSVGQKGGGASLDMAQFWNGKAGKLRQAIWTYLQANPPAGAEDIAKALGVDADNVSPRCSELTTEAFGRLLVKGPRDALTARNNRAHVYQIREQGSIAA